MLGMICNSRKKNFEENIESLKIINHNTNEENWMIKRGRQTAEI